MSMDFQSSRCVRGSVLTAALVAAACAMPGCKSAAKDTGGARPAQNPPAIPNAMAAATPQDQRMAWWREARFGMFIHWGIYAVAAGEWNGKDTTGAGEWIMNDMKIPVSEYEPLAKRFNPVKFDSKKWADIASNAGMKYMVITSKHHDGFAMFKTSTNPYNIVDGTPWGKDPMMGLAAACKQDNLHFCFYHSIMDWHSPDFNEAKMDSAYIPYMKSQIKELLTNYGPIGVMWFDGEWPKEWTQERGEDLAAYVRGLQPQIIINNRVAKARKGMSGLSAFNSGGDYDTPEQEVPAVGLPGVDWETCMTMNDTWGFSKHDVKWKSSTTLIRTLCDVASKGGNFLLNVGPTPEGEIPYASVERLADMGRWMKVNSEAIYGTQASPFGKTSWGRCTYKPAAGAGGDDVLYLMVFDWPKNGVLGLSRVGGQVRSASMLGGGSLKAKQTGHGVEIVLPHKRVDTGAEVIKLTMRGGVQVQAWRPTAAANGDVVLSCVDATTGAKIEERGGQPNIGFWTNESQKVWWEFGFPRSGRYEVICNVSSENASAGQKFDLSIAGQQFNSAVPATGGWEKFVDVSCGVVNIESGPQTLEIKPSKGMKGPLMNLRSVTLRPVR